MTYSMGENDAQIDFVSVGKYNSKYLKDGKAILWALQHRLVITALDKKKLNRSSEEQTNCQEED